MIEIQGSTLRVSGPMTMPGARQLREQGLAAARSTLEVVDLSGVEAVDSSALAVLLAWQRAAHERDARLSFAAPPASLRSLASLYRLDELLGDSA